MPSKIFFKNHFNHAPSPRWEFKGKRHCFWCNGEVAESSFHVYICFDNIYLVPILCKTLKIKQSIKKDKNICVPILYILERETDGKQYFVRLLKYANRI